MKQKSNFTFLLSYAKNEKYKLYLSAFLSVCSSILMVCLLYTSDAADE